MLSAIRNCWVNYRTPTPAPKPKKPAAAPAPLAKATRPVYQVPPPPKKLTNDGVHHLHGRDWHLLQPLLMILGINRCADGPGMEVVIASCLEGLVGTWQDTYGNWFLEIDQEDGSRPEVLFTSHLDTVSGDRQKIWHPLCYNLEKDVLFRDNTHCLGADCGTGVWLMLEMIKAKVPGLYAFYLDEESGRRGSIWSHKNAPQDEYRFIDRVISFDRKGKTDIVGTQKGRRCCSDLFQNALAELLGMGYKINAQGSFTDSATFMDDTPECTNISVGYYDQHTSRETQHVGHALALRAKLIEIGQAFHDLPVGRVPTPPAPPAPPAPYVSPGYANPYHRPANTLPKNDRHDDEWDRYLQELADREAWAQDDDDENILADMVADLQAMSSEELVEQHSDFVVDLLASVGLYHEDIIEYIEDQLDTLASPLSTTQKDIRSAYTS